MEFNSLPFINSVHHLCSKFSSLFSHPLFSIVVTLYTLILLYAPSFFLRIVLSPVLNSSGIILLLLLKLGASEILERESDYSKHRVLDHIDKQCYENLTSYSSFVLESTSLKQRFLELVDRNRTDSESHQMQVEFEHDLGLESNSHDNNSMESSHVAEKRETRMETDSKQVYTTVEFLKWNMKAPLEIIYETYEGEDDVDDDYDYCNGNKMVSSDKDVSEFERYPSLSMYYPESETDSSSDEDFLMNRNSETYGSMFSKWDDYDPEELIEIPVDRYEKRSIEFCHVEEDNLIEINIFPMTK